MRIAVKLRQSLLRRHFTVAPNGDCERAVVFTLSVLASETALGRSMVPEPVCRLYPAALSPLLDHFGPDTTSAARASVAIDPKRISLPTAFLATFRQRVGYDWQTIAGGARMASDHVQRKLAAILAADVVGYSRLTGADEEGTARRLRALRAELIDPAIEVNRGRIVKTTGDGILIEFASVVDAVRCALEVQHGMAVRNAHMPTDQRIQFRVGINLGDVMVEPDGDLMGDGVNIAARLEGIAEPGGICLSRSAYEQVKGKIELTVQDRGEQRLKNIAEPVRVYKVDIGGTDVRSPRSGSRIITGAAMAIILLAVIGGGVWLMRGANAPPPAADAGKPAARLSIVVLPFANLSGDVSQDYLGDVLTEELTTSLSRLPDSFVVSRTTAFAYRGKAADVKQIGRELGVRYALEGSAQKSGKRVRVSAQLIDTETGAHLWADQFDADQTDLLEMQDEIVTRLARTLQIQLSAVEASRVARSHPSAVQWPRPSAPAPNCRD